MKSESEIRRSVDALADRNSTTSLGSIAVDTLQPFDHLKLKTGNSEYNIFILSPELRVALIQGGKYFRLPVEVVISGANLGNHLHTEGTIEVGRGLVFTDQTRRIITSNVEEIKVQRVSNN